mmetsp:Transcript_16284/g.27790  ORF Transcript_16284/g.27790 Transcript_16284/m.27790 type:complete len:100 (+) Transcript_16284:49-348(+)
MFAAGFDAGMNDSHDFEWTRIGDARNHIDAFHDDSLMLWRNVNIARDEGARKTSSLLAWQVCHQLTDLLMEELIPSVHYPAVVLTEVRMRWERGQQRCG